MTRLLFFVYSGDEATYSQICEGLDATGLVELISSVAADVERLREVLTTAQIDGLYVDLGDDPGLLLDILEELPEPRPALLLGGQNTDPAVLLRAMRLQPKDFCVDNDLSNVEKVIQQLAASQTQSSSRRRERRGTLAVAGAKGGVGTTLIACELAAALQRDGDSVAVIDLNLCGGDAAMYFDLKPPYTIADIAKKGDALDPTYLRTVTSTHISGVRVLSAPAEPEDENMIGARHVERTIELARSEFDWVVLDLPTFWRDTTLRALDMSDQILLVTTLDVPALTHTRRQMDLLERFGAPEDHVRVIVNKATRNTEFGEKELREFLGRDTDVTVPSDPATALACINEGKLLHDVAKGGRVETAIRQLADLACEWTTGQPVERTSGNALFERVKSFVTGS